jgi:hypothetical protein
LSLSPLSSTFNFSTLILLSFTFLVILFQSFLCLLFPLLLYVLILLPYFYQQYLNPFILKQDTQPKRQGNNKSQYTRMTSTLRDLPRRMWMVLQRFDIHCSNHLQFPWKFLGLM